MKNRDCILWLHEQFLTCDGTDRYLALYYIRHQNALFLRADMVADDFKRKLKVNYNSQKTTRIHVSRNLDVS